MFRLTNLLKKLEQIIEIQGFFKDRYSHSSTFQDKIDFQGLFKTNLYFQVLFKPVRTLSYSSEVSHLLRVQDNIDLIPWREL